MFKSLSKLGLYNILFILLVTAFFTFTILHNAQDELQEKIQTLELNYIKNKKSLLKDEVQSLVRDIRYIDESNNFTRQEAQQKALEFIRLTKDKSNKNYFFIYDTKGNLVRNPFLKSDIGKNFLHLKSKNNKFIIKDFISASENPNGEFYEYEWFNPLIDRFAKKVSFVGSYKKWGWVIGKGVYLHEIDELVEDKKMRYKQKLGSYYFEILFLTLLLVGYTIFMYRNFTKVVKKDIDIVRGFFENSNANANLVKAKNLSLDEFKIILHHAYGAMLKIKQKTDELEDINKNLENIVEDKTTQLRELVKSQKRFIKRSAHEINTPLAIIQNNIDLLKMKVPQNRYVTHIEAGTKMIACIYEDLSFMIKKDRIEYKSEQLNFSQILTQRVEFFDEIAKSNSLAFSCKIDEDIYIVFNQTMLQRVIDNNFTNAIKYSFPNSVIVVNLSYFGEDEIEFCVTTHSKNIDDEKKIFESFYRENDSKGGFGLGLNIVKDICDRNSVKIDVNSQNETTSFIYRFKIDENTTA